MRLLEQTVICTFFWMGDNLEYVTKLPLCRSGVSLSSQRDRSYVRRSGRQPGINVESGVRTPFQKTVTFDGSNATTLHQFTPQEASFTVPNNRTLVIQQVTAMGGTNPGSIYAPADGDVFKLTTVAGGSAATYEFAARSAQVTASSSDLASALRFLRRTNAQQLFLRRLLPRFRCSQQLLVLHRGRCIGASNQDLLDGQSGARDGWNVGEVGRPSGIPNPVIRHPGEEAGTTASPPMKKPKTGVDHKALSLYACSRVVVNGAKNLNTTTPIAANEA